MARSGDQAQTDTGRAQAHLIIRHYVNKQTAVVSLWYLLLFPLALVLAPFAAEAVRRPIHKRALKNAPGAVARLVSGNTHYKWTGPENAPIAVCIHGLSTPSYIFAATEQSLIARGYRVLTYDLYGRGYSARPGGAQNEAFFLAQLRALLADQKIDEPFVLLGFSMGGQIAAAYAARHFAQVDQLVLVAPAGLSPVSGHRYSRLWTAPWVGGWMARVCGGWALRKELIGQRDIATVIPDLELRQASETRTRGFLPALLSSRRHLLSQTAEDHHKKIYEHGTPVLAIWAAKDPVIPLSAMGLLAKLNPNAQHVQVPGAGHNVLQTHPAQVSEALRAFLDEGAD